MPRWNVLFNIKYYTSASNEPTPCSTSVGVLPQILTDNWHCLADYTKSWILAILCTMSGMNKQLYGTRHSRGTRHSFLKPPKSWETHICLFSA